MALEQRLDRGQVPAKTQVAVFGTLPPDFNQPFDYEQEALGRAVERLSPDLLLIEISPEQWERGDAKGLPPEYKAGLLQIGANTDAVVVPIGLPYADPWRVPEGTPLASLRRWHVRFLHRLLARLAHGSPARLSSAAYGRACRTICSLLGRLCGPEAQAEWDEQNRRLLDNVLIAVRRDPGRRVVLAIDCRRRRYIVEGLRRAGNIDVVHEDQLWAEPR